MRPNTFHYVITLEHSIVFGRHFYAAATIRPSVWGAIHNIMVGNMVCNEDHPEVCVFLRRMLAFSCSEYEKSLNGGDNAGDGV